METDRDAAPDVETEDATNGAPSKQPGPSTMDPGVATCLKTLTLGEMQRYRNLALLPLFSSQPEGPAYLTLAEALAAGTLMFRSWAMRAPSRSCRCRIRESNSC